MTLLETIRAIEEVASAQPSVNMIVENDIYKISSRNDARYGIFAFVQRDHAEDIESDFMSFKFAFIYVDRLIEDKSNQLEVQSTGIRTLGNILEGLRSRNIWSDAVTYNTFNERFADDCAGVFCEVTLNVMRESLCGEEFEKKTIKII